MDKTLAYNPTIMDKIILDFREFENSFSEIQFKVWTEIPEIYQFSYYTNEQTINPKKESFDNWKLLLSKRPNPLYSLAICGNDIISSVYGAGLEYERTMNLWATKSEFRQKGIGKIVLLNFIKHSFESNSKLPIRAWDITSQQVDIVLNSIGFK